eukprot:3388656-Prymnesium_polylepis.1
MRCHRLLPAPPRTPRCHHRGGWSTPAPGPHGSLAAAAYSTEPSHMQRRAPRLTVPAMHADPSACSSVWIGAPEAVQMRAASMPNRAFAALTRPRRPWTKTRSPSLAVSSARPLRCSRSRCTPALPT